MRSEKLDCGLLVYLGDEAEWLVLRVRTGRELLARAWLEMRGDQAYVPLLRRTVRARRRHRQREHLAVAWPGYMFAGGSLAAEGAPGCADILGPLAVYDGEGRQVPYLLTDAEVERIKAMEADGFTGRSQLAARRGEIARVASGLFRGMEGEVLDCNGDGTVTLRLKGSRVTLPSILIEGA